MNYAFRIVVLSMFIAAMPIVSAAETCPSMGVMATNYGNAAYQATRDEPELIDRIGFFEVWMSLLGKLLEGGEKAGMQSPEFFAATKHAGRSLMANKDLIHKQLPPAGYTPLFSKMTIRFCEDIGGLPKK